MPSRGWTRTRIGSLVMSGRGLLRREAGRNGRRGMCAIKKIRKCLYLSPRQFGILCGLTGKNISRTVLRWENGTLKIPERIKVRIKKWGVEPG